MTDWPYPTAPLVLFASTLVPLPFPVEVPCTPRLYRHLGYTMNVPCFYHSLFLAPFVAGNMEYFKIWGGVAPGGENILNIFFTLYSSPSY